MTETPGISVGASGLERLIAEQEDLGSITPLSKCFPLLRRGYYVVGI